MSRATVLLQLLMIFSVGCATLQGFELRGNNSKPQSDWIWNQLHCWEGLLKPTQIGKIQSVWHKEGETKYQLQGEGVGTIFKVDPDTGDICVYRELDRETKDRYKLKGIVINKKTLKQIGPTTNFTIQVLDVNDNAPIFTKDPFNGTVAEMSRKGTSVLTITAHDPDDPTVNKHAVVTYKILSKQDNFYINPDTGIIYVNNSNLDRERKKDYQLIVQAKDMEVDQGGMSSSATVYISLTDINDNAPFFQHRQYNYTASEATPIGVALGRVKAEDLDEGENAKILYTVISNNIFQITTDPHTQEGVITLKKPLDFETQRLHRVHIEAENPTLVKGMKYKTSTTLVIEVLDVNEPPEFSQSRYIFRVTENQPESTSVGRVSASDPDQAKERIRYSLQDGLDLFRIEDNGMIYTREPLDREAFAWHNITVAANEVGNSNSISYAPIAIKVLDQNDNAPTLADSYYPHVCEDDPVGTVIQVISAVDMDETPPDVKFFFSIPLKVSNFSVKNNGDNTANITVNQAGFNQNEVSKFSVPIIISDNGTPRLSSNNTLEINVCSCNRDRDPINCRHIAPLSSGVTVTILLIIILCIIVTIALAVLIVRWRMQQKSAFGGLVKAPGEIREQLVQYDEEGGGEMDTNSFDITVLNSLRTKGAQPLKVTDCAPVYAQVRKPGDDMGSVVRMKKDEADGDRDGLPYDTLHIYGYEGADSVAESLSSLDVSSIDSEQDYDFLNDWGPRFQMLAELYGSDPDRESLGY
ncbi:cadherin-5-like [Pristis pectinata]|uniref:cadherin-5-like n=1 Tax=Pristis pectinata TaxID=685728 RepID=UPI00223D4226|nr:cadherin-5-like [Pristis pectinata]XP_051884162.1 cadherin-5-like [Pristis pectinata]